MCTITYDMSLSLHHAMIVCVQTQRNREREGFVTLKLIGKRIPWEYQPLIPNQ